MENTNVVALIPARGGSKGLTRKNIINLCGKPLIAHKIEHALRSKLIDRVVVSTEDEEIADVAVRFGAEVPFMRPKELAADHVSDFPVIEHAMEWFDKNDWKTEIIAFLRPCNVFITPEEMDMAIEKIIGTDFDSIRGISKTSFSPYWMKRTVGENLVPFIVTGYEQTRRQELPDVYWINGAIEVLRKEIILERKSMYGDKIGFIKMDEITNNDINSELDFKIVEYLFPLWQKKVLEK